MSIFLDYKIISGFNKCLCIKNQLNQKTKDSVFDLVFKQFIYFMYFFLLPYKFIDMCLSIKLLLPRVRSPLHVTKYVTKS